MNTNELLEKLNQEISDAIDSTHTEIWYIVSNEDENERIKNVFYNLQTEIDEIIKKYKINV